jgi:MoaA/NifB/PqqE/SkfB family radical SAM enzyme
MPLNVFEKLAQEVKAYTDHVYLHVKGEPLLHPQLAEILDVCHNNLLKVNLVTNGTLIQSVQEMLLHKPALRQINFSLHSFEEQPVQYKENYIENILNFTRQALNTTPLIVSFRLWNIPQNYLMYNIQNKDIISSIQHFFQPSFNLYVEQQKARSVKIAPNLYLNSDVVFDWPDIADSYEDTAGFCYGLRDQAAILVDGTVVPCCLDGEGIINLGNAFEESFGMIIKSKRAENIYKGFTANRAVEPLCIKCKFKNKFGE